MEKIFSILNFYFRKMDFSKLSNKDLSDFLTFWEQKVPPLRVDMINLASQLFEAVSQREDASYTTPVVDLWISSSLGTISEKYDEDFIKNLSQENKEIFAETFGLDVNAPDFTERLLRILGFLGALEISPLWEWPVKEREFPIPLTYPVTKNFELNKIKETRNWIGTVSRIPTDLSIFNESSLKTLYELYDHYFFNGALPKFISFAISNRLTKTAGRCGPCPGKKCECRYQLSFSRPLLAGLKLKEGETTVSGGVQCSSNLECLQLVMEHELTHLILRIKYPNRSKLEKSIYSSHGALFKQVVLSYFGQIRSTHNIGSTIINEDLGEPVEKSTLKIGDFVAYQKEDEVLKGIVTNIMIAYAGVDFSNEKLKVRFEALRYLDEDDEDIEYLEEEKNRILKLLEYYNNLKEGDRVQVKYKDQILKGQVWKFNKYNKLDIKLPDYSKLTASYIHLILPQQIKREGIELILDGVRNIEGIVLKKDKEWTSFFGEDHRAHIEANRNIYPKNTYLSPFAIYYSRNLEDIRKHFDTLKEGDLVEFWSQIGKKEEGVINTINKQEKTMNIFVTESREEKNIPYIALILTREIKQPTITPKIFDFNMAKVGMKVAADFKEGPRYGIIVKKNPVNAVVYLLSRETYNIPYSNLKEVQTNSQLNELEKEINNSRQILSKIKPGQVIIVWLSGKRVSGKFIQLRPRSAGFVIDINGRKYNMDDHQIYEI